MEKIFRFCTWTVYLLAVTALMLMSLGFIGIAVYQVVSLGLIGQPITAAMLNGVGLIIISLAVFDVSKFLFEEELLRDRELRSIRETRRTLSKFVTIIIIAASLESLVFVFEAGTERIQDLIYPSLLLAVVVLLIVGLSHYQRVSAAAEQEDPKDDRD